jgi:hypothetical protein
MFDNAFRGLAAKPCHISPNRINGLFADCKTPCGRSSVERKPKQAHYQAHYVDVGQAGVWLSC